MRDELRDTLLNRGGGKRAEGSFAFPQSGNMPTGIPSDPARVPPRIQRFETAQRMIEGYQNNWQPNPIVTRIVEGSK